MTGTNDKNSNAIWRYEAIHAAFLMLKRRNDLKHYKVRIVETLVMNVDVEAESAGEAEQIVSDRWRDSEYLLDADNFSGVEFEAREDERLRDRRSRDAR